MGRVNYTGYQINLGAANSNLTGGAWYVGDAATLTVSIQSSTGSASRYTILGSNGDGFQSALGTPSQTVPAGGWSIITTITSQGLYTIDTGFRWINSVRTVIDTSAASNVTILFTQKVN
jgi:hypothetical protein